MSTSTKVAPPDDPWAVGPGDEDMELDLVQALDLRRDGNSGGMNVKTPETRKNLSTFLQPSLQQTIIEKPQVNFGPVQHLAGVDVRADGGLHHKLGDGQPQFDEDIQEGDNIVQDISRRGKRKLAPDAGPSSESQHFVAQDLDLKFKGLTFNKAQSHKLLEDVSTAASKGKRLIDNRERDRKKKEAFDRISLLNESYRKMSEKPDSFMFPMKEEFDPHCLRKETAELLGKGTYGEVWKYLDPHNRQVVLKKIKAKNGKNVINLNEIMIPSEFASSGQFPNVYAVEWNIMKEEFLLFLEYTGRNLRQRLHEPWFTASLKSEERMKSLALQLFRGLCCLHKENIIHRDLKLENVTLDDHDVLRIIDFGSARTSRDEGTEEFFAGTTPEYLPPKECGSAAEVREAFERGERKTGIPVSMEADVWGGGMVIASLQRGGHAMIHFFTGNTDYDNTTIQAPVWNEISKLKDPLPDALLRPLDYPKTQHEGIEKMLRGCLMVDEKKRWTADMAVKFLQAPWSQTEHIGGPAPKFRKLNTKDREKIFQESLRKVEFDKEHQPKYNLHVLNVKKQKTFDFNSGMSELKVAVKPSLQVPVAETAATFNARHYRTIAPRGFDTASASFNHPSRVMCIQQPPAAVPRKVILPASPPAAPSDEVPAQGMRGLKLQEQQQAQRSPKSQVSVLPLPLGFLQQAGSARVVSPAMPLASAANAAGRSLLQHSSNQQQLQQQQRQAQMSPAIHQVQQQWRILSARHPQQSALRGQPQLIQQQQRMLTPSAKSIVVQGTQPSQPPQAEDKLDLPDFGALLG